MDRELKKNFVRAMIQQKLIGVGLLGVGIAATLLVPGGIGVNVLSAPLGLAAILIPVPMIETKATYEYWRIYEELNK